MGHGFCMFYKLLQSIWDGWWAIGICLSGSCNSLGNPKTLILGPWTATTAWVHGLPYGLVHGLSLSKRLLRSAKFWLLPRANVKGMVSGSWASYIIIDMSISLEMWKTGKPPGSCSLPFAILFSPMGSWTHSRLHNLLNGIQEITDETSKRP